MTDLTVIKSTLTRSFSRGGLLLKKYSPEILLGLGLTGVVAGTVLAVKNTMKANETIEAAKKNLELVNEVMVNESEQDRTKALAMVYVQTGLELAKLYGPAISVSLFSIASILASHGIMQKRQVSLVAAYGLLAEGFQSYRNRVVEELGKETDRNFRHGLREEEYTEKSVGEDGKTVKTKKVNKVYDPSFKSDYARFFDQTSNQWKKDPTHNLIFLKAQQNYANDLLRSRGHLFLNEVYEMLGIPWTPAGQMVGWVMNGDGDQFVDFDIYNVENQPGREFVNGYNNAILLDFNVDGEMWNKI
jgi:hypothetical protein